MAPIQITTRKGLTKPMNRLVIPMMKSIARSVGNIIRERKLRCGNDIKCLYELIILRHEIIDVIIKVIREWQRRIPVLFDVFYDDDEEPERIEIFIPLRTNIVHIRYTVDMLENPFELKFFVETAINTFSEPVSFKTARKYLYMPLEPVETLTIPA